ncbi:MAG: 1-deoxy-D-xylulose-5-phosphate reductoisomerase [Mycoplasmatales bacterium]
MKKRIAILGASGSIGTQTIDVIKNNPQMFELIGVSVGNNFEYLNQLLEEFPSITTVSVKNKEDIEKIKNKKIKADFGINGLNLVATLNDIDILITAVVGSVGLEPTINAIKNGTNIGLANKETLVTAGHLIMPLVKEMKINLYPIDSEHSAIFQCLNGESTKQINKIILTASGGSFRDKTLEDLKDVSVRDALNHPNWSMGAKITIDSATMFNKGLEIIEAHHLFDISYDDIEVLIHRQSIIHSMVEFDDYSVIAQLGTPDMRLPIQYAMTYPSREKIINSERLNLSQIGELDFKPVDLERFKAVALSYQAGRIGGTMPTVLNAANEVAVDLFLNEKIKFIEIENIVKHAMDNHKVIDNPSLEKIIEIDKKIRKIIYENWRV